MINKPIFPTQLHAAVAKSIHNFFAENHLVDTVLVVNSCARGQAVPESDLDFAILLKPSFTKSERKKLESDWLLFANSNKSIQDYKASGPYAHLHLDLIDGKYNPGTIDIGEPINYFEIEIGNQIGHSAPLNEPGKHYLTLREKWLPFYNETLRQERLKNLHAACLYDLTHIALFVKRGLYFQAFDILCKAFQEYLQLLFIANKTYPIAYNKWVREQVVNWLNQPQLYPKLAPVLSIKNIESVEILEHAKMLKHLLNEVKFV
ncbi:MAG: nucleotidyltransferase domain-containing protein [Bacteroidota bacterium]